MGELLGTTWTAATACSHDGASSCGLTSAATHPQSSSCAAAAAFVVVDSASDSSVGAMVSVLSCGGGGAAGAARAGWPWGASLDDEDLKEKDNIEEHVVVTDGVNCGFVGRWLMLSFLVRLVLLLLLLRSHLSPLFLLVPNVCLRMVFSFFALLVGS